MKTNKLVCSLAAIVLLATGCDDIRSPEIRETNQRNVNYPIFVADTPKGKLFQITIERGGGRHADRIYYFENDTNITINSTVPSGKSTYNQAVMVINGIEYVPKN